MKLVPKFDITYTFDKEESTQLVPHPRPQNHEDVQDLSVPCCSASTNSHERLHFSTCPRSATVAVPWACAAMASVANDGNTLTVRQADDQ